MTDAGAHQERPPDAGHGAGGVALRVLHVTPYYEGAWGYGGIPRVTAALTRGLARRGHRVAVCTTDARDGRSRLRPGEGGASAAAGLDVRVFPNVSNRLAYHLQLFLPRGLDAYLRHHARDFDIAHLHGHRHLPGVHAARRLRAAGVPYVVTPNGTAPRIERRRILKYLFDAALGRSVLPGAAGILAVTEAERRQLGGLGLAPEAITVVPNPVDLDEFRPVPDGRRFRERLGLAGAPVVLFLGRITPRKGVAPLVRAVARLGRPAVRLVVAGNDAGGGRAGRRLAARLGVPATFTGLLAGRQRLEALAAADVVAYPARHEAFGLVPVEALLCGTPVVVAGDGGAGEVITRVGGGILVPPADPEALATAIAAILDAPAAWRARVVDAQPRVRAAYGAEPVARALEDLYERILGRPAADEATGP
jgi:glycosyltransferase involved in cell wall biosynthesis